MIFKMAATENWIFVQKYSYLMMYCRCTIIMILVSSWGGGGSSEPNSMESYVIDLEVKFMKNSIWLPENGTLTEVLIMYSVLKTS